MSAIKLNAFGGIFPRTPASLLPETAASLCVNAELAYGELRSHKQPEFLKTLINAAVSFYTEDGDSFFSWTGDVDAVKGTVIGDTYRRVYFTTGSGMFVAPTNGTQLSLSGGPPPTSYRAGVPRPTVKPKLTVADGSADITITARFHYEDNGTKYQEQPITLNAMTPPEPLKKYWFTAPARNKAPIGGSASIHTITGVGDFTYRLGPRPVESAPAFTVQITGPAQVTVVDPAGASVAPWNLTAGLTWAGVPEVALASGGVAQVAALYAGNPTTPPAGNYTPDSAAPVLYITGKNNTTNETVFGGYTSNSGLSEAGQKGRFTVTNDASVAGKHYVSFDLTGTVAGDEETRAYVYTCVNSYGEEGAPSPPAVVTVPTLGAAYVEVTKPAHNDMVPLSEIRVYRSLSGTDSDNYHFVMSIPCLSLPSGLLTAVKDEKKAAELAEVLRSTFWLPPDNALVGLCNIGNGMLAAFKNNELWTCEAHRPHAWSPNNVLTFPNAIVAIEPHGTGCVVCTTQEPYIVSGVSPDSLTSIKLNIPQSCMNKRAITSVGNSVVFASPDGLVTISGGQASLALSERYFTREVWRTRFGGETAIRSVRLASHDGSLVAYFPTSATGFIIRLDEAAGSMTDFGWSNLNSPIIFAKAAPLADALFISCNGAIYKWGSGTSALVTWYSKEAIYPKPLNWGAMRAVVGPGSTFSITFYADGAAVHSVNVTSSGYFRLPAGFKSQRWMIAVSGTGTLRELYIGETMRDLASV